MLPTKVTASAFQLVKNPPAMQETWVRSLGWENPLEKGMAAHSNLLAWRIPWTEEPGRATVSLTHSRSPPAVGHPAFPKAINSLVFNFLFFPAEGNSYPLQYSGLENSTDCIVHEVAKSQRQLRNFHFTSLPPSLWSNSQIWRLPV